LADAARKPFSETLAAEGLADEIDECARLYPQQARTALFR
jgi:hypothetical protein